MNANKLSSSAEEAESASLSTPPAYHQQQDKTNPFYNNSNNSTDNISIRHSVHTTDHHEKTAAYYEDASEKVTYKWKFILRLFQMLCVIGSFGFQASANTWSNRDSIPFESVALLFFFYAAEWFAFIWSAFCTYVCLSVKFGSQNVGNIKPSVVLAMDTLLAIVLGIGISMEIGTYTCPAGGFNGWCNFYNVGLCFGMMLFLSFGVSALWHLFSGLSCLRTKSSNLV